MDIVVIGAGYVGLTAACCLAASGHNVTGVEIDRNKINFLNQGISTIHENGMEGLLKKGLASGKLKFASSFSEPFQPDIVMVAVGTPSLPDGSADLSAIHQVAEGLRKVIRQPLPLIMKSSVPPGTGIRLVQRYFRYTPITYFSNPEFLREGQAINDWNCPERIVIGTSGEEKDPQKVLQLYTNCTAPVLITDITSAEAIKYASNAFLITKISFINEMANYCEAIGADIDAVARGIGLDKRIGPHFLRAGVGYGGSCFPKDARALDCTALEVGYDFRLLKAAIEVNSKQRFLTVNKLKKYLDGLEGKRITLLGLAFKPETDDVRESPAIDIANLLRKEGAGIAVYDPAAMENAKQFLPADIIFSPDMYTAVTGSQAVLLITEWPEFIEADWAAIKKQMRHPYLVLDGRNALEQDKLRSLGFRYMGIGRELK